MLKLPTYIEAQFEEIALILPPHKWILVGGLMVHIHASISGIMHPRETNDIDVVVLPGDYFVSAGALQKAGYTAREPLKASAPFHRFVRGSQIVDLMIPENSTSRFLGRSIVSVPGSKSAMRHATSVQVGAQTILVPGLASALSLKGAALETDGLNRIRHENDGITLFACIASQRLSFSKSMRQHVNRMITSLSSAESWKRAVGERRRRAIAGIRTIRPDWKPPAFALPRRPSN